HTITFLDIVSNEHSLSTYLTRPGTDHFTNILSEVRRWGKVNATIRHLLLGETPDDDHILKRFHLNSPVLTRMLLMFPESVTSWLIAVMTALACAAEENPKGVFEVAADADEACTVDTVAVGDASCTVGVTP